MLAGSGAVGKTSLLKVLKINKSLEECNDLLEYHRTFFFDCEQVATEQYNGIFQVFDIAGQLDLPIHALRDTPRAVLGKVDLVILVFANDNVNSLLEIQVWMELIIDYYNKNNEKHPSFILINNKIDVERTIDEELITLAKEQNGVKGFFEVSCLNGEGIGQLKKWLEEHFFKPSKEGDA